MIKPVEYLFAFILFLALSIQGVQAAESPPAGSAFPDLKIAAPKTDAEKDYLGLKEKAPFKVSQIKAQVVILEIFSMYCPYCQKEAPLINELYNMIDKRPELKGKIKILGIGAGNTPFEIDVFKNQYHIPFPLFSDEDYSIHKAAGEVRTPYFFVFKMNPDGSNKIIYSKVGSIQNPEQFLDLIVRESGLKQEG